MWQLNDEFKSRMIVRLTEPLPGVEAQMKLSPQPVNLDRFVVRERPDARPCAVLILFHRGDSGLHFPLIQRPVYLGAHSGQVALPGGKHELEDENLIYTALREAKEEIGADPSAIKILGTLSELYVPASNFKVLPVVAFTDASPTFVPDQHEVVEVLSASVQELFQQKIEIKEMMVGEGMKIISPYYQVNNRVIWGATAMMLAELLQVLEEVR